MGAAYQRVCDAEIDVISASRVVGRQYGFSQADPAVGCLVGNQCGDTAGIAARCGVTGCVDVENWRLIVDVCD